MSKILIKKTVSLDFLGDEYKGSYIVFKSIPLSNYERMMDELPSPDKRYVELVNKSEGATELTDSERTELANLQTNETEKNKQNLRFIVDYLKEYYVGGKFPNENGELEDIDGKEELDGLDKDAAVRCFNVLMGQDDDPKENEK